MNNLKIVKSLVLAMLVVITSLFCTGSSSAQTKKVFAHYMVCNRDYGGSVAGYLHDIQDAQAYGVDGFSLNIGEWSTNANYQQNVVNLFAAAQGTSFKLFFSSDHLPAADIVSMMQTYSSHANYFKYNNRPVLSTYGGDMMGGGGLATRDWWRNNVLNPLISSGINVYFVPNFSNNPATATPDPTIMANNYNAWWKDVVDGMYFFGAAFLPSYTAPSLLAGGEAYASLMHSNSKTYMATVSPQYWGSKQVPGRRYFEYEGGKGIAAQWASVMQVQQPEWVELTTWNDFDEGSYFTPMDDVNLHWPYTAHPTLGFYKNRTGIAKLNQYYIDWYKNYAPTQAPPPPGYVDNLYYIYRTHSKNLTCSDPVGPVTEIIGNLQDSLYITTILINSAQLVVNSGGTITTYNVSAGITHTAVPFHAGAQSFTLKRNNVSVLAGSGPSIASSITEYNFNYTSGWLHN